MQQRKNTASSSDSSLLQNGTSRLLRNRLHKRSEQQQQQISYLHSSSLLPAFLIAVCPTFAVILTYISSITGGTYSEYYSMQIIIVKAMFII